MQSMKKASEAEENKTSASTSKARPSKQSVELSDPNIHLNLRTSDHSDAQPMEMEFLHFHHSSPNVYSPIIAPSTPIFIPNTRNNLQGFVFLKPRNTRTKRNTRFGQNTFHSLHLQRRISPLSMLKSLLSPKRLLLSKTNNRITQTQSFTGR